MAQLVAMVLVAMVARVVRAQALEAELEVLVREHRVPATAEVEQAEVILQEA
jgi:hypothetical protein